MGLFQKAIETYDTYSAYVGSDKDEYKTFAPILHSITNAGLEITLNQDGNFVSARKVGKEEPKIFIPVTEDSESRSSGISPHPLCDKLEYLSPNNTEKYTAYLEQLESWTNSEYTHPMLKPILTYIKNQTILQDLETLGIIQLKDNNTLDNKKDTDQIVCWIVHGLGTPKEGCWQQYSLFEAFQNWYLNYWHSFKKKDLPRNICMVIGKWDAIPEKHPKKIILNEANAKLISSNDNKGFTFRGRFIEPREACTIGYTASQKAHNALRWLISTQSVPIGNRRFLCWSPQGVTVCNAVKGFQIQEDQEILRPSDYQDNLKKTLNGYKSNLPEQNATVIIAAFEAATPGRLSVTYYNQLMNSDYLERLHQWDKHCCWYFRYKKYSICSPSLYEIVDCAFGKPITKNNQKKLETDEKVRAQHIQRLVSCRIDGIAMPVDIVKSLVNRASTPLAYDSFLWEKILFVACAVIKKYHYDFFKEEYEMELAPEKADRSYQFGRLLAVLEKVERATYKKGEEREPYAIRMMSLFHRRPMTTAHDIEQHLEKAYFTRLKVGSRAYYKKLIGEIMQNISQYPQEEWNRPLNENYLMGYYLQRNDLYPSKQYSEEEME